ncbi:MAG: BatA domain-containing protein [Planctomycetales bacterium]|nr:BatA domain-containing protein [Planctomycetales bacterium]
MSFLQPLMLVALPLIALPIIIHLINQWRYQTRRWGAMMFLLAANRMNRGFARIRQWLILAMRTLAVLGLILAVSRPLSSGLLGLTGGGKTDTTILILDRSPSMQQLGSGGVSKLDTGRRQLANALQTLGSQRWVAIDSSGQPPQSYEDLEALLASPSLQGTSATADLPTMMQSALDYLTANKPGPTEIWICSDLQEADWNAESGTWSVVREGFEKLPQSVRINLLAYPQMPTENMSVRVTDVKQSKTVEQGISSNELLLSMQITRSDELAEDKAVSVPVEITIDGATTTINVEMNGARVDVRNHRIPLDSNQTRGWGRIAIPADSNNADNQYYFVFDEPPVRRVVIVSEDRSTTRALEIAASVSEDGSINPAVEVLAPEQLDSLVLDETSLVIWQTRLPDAATAPALTNYINAGGQVLFFPPSRLVQSGSEPVGQQFFGVAWDQWQASDVKVMVENWRSDQDLLAATASGTGLPVGQLSISAHATLRSTADLSKLATLSGGDPLIARVPTSKGGVYFCTASTAPDASSLAENGIVLYITVQRAIQRGQLALGNTTQRTAEFSQEVPLNWKQVSGPENILSTEYSAQSGVYQSGKRLFAVNRSAAEDRRDILQDDRVAGLFAGLPFARVDDQAGNLTGIVREVWRLFLIGMILAMLIEAALCIPRRYAVASSAA